MRRVLLTASAAALLLLAVPDARAEDDPVACDPPAAGVTVLKPNATFAGTIDAPFLIDDVTEKKFQLDLGLVKETSTASVDGGIEWSIAANDFDLNVSDSEGNLYSSEGFQPLDGPTEAIYAEMLHCTEITVQVLNYTAVGVPAPVDTISLTLTVGKVK